MFSAPCDFVSTAPYSYKFGPSSGTALLTMTVADYSRQALLRQCCCIEVRESSSGKNAFFPTMYLLHLHLGFRVASGFILFSRLTHLQMPYAVSVRQVSGLPPASFRSRLAADTLALGYVLGATPCTRDFHPLERTHAERTMKNTRSSAMEEPGVDLFKPQRLSTEALKAGLEHVLDTNLAADGRRAVFAAANHHVGIEHQVAVDGAQTEVGLNRRHVKDVLACAVDLDFLVAERRNVGNLEARRERPAGGRNFTARDAERNRHLDIGEVGVRRFDRADRHVIRFQMRDAQADARNELEGTRGKLVLSTHAGGVDVHVKLLVHGRLRSRDLVFRLEPCEFAHHLRITELLAGVSRQAVALDAVLDGGDVATNRSVSDGASWSSWKRADCPVAKRKTW